MLEFIVNLNTVIFWTKRIIALITIIIFFFAGVRFFQILSSRLTVRNEIVGIPKSEAGYGKLPSIEFKTLENSKSFRPSKFRISTISGLLDTENSYPKEETLYPIGNVFKIKEISIDLSTSEDPIKISQTFNFSSKYKEISNIIKEWNENNRMLLINGLYKTIKYKNNNLKRKNQTPSKITNNDQAKNLFQNIIRYMNIPTNFENYKFTYSYLDFDANTNEFVYTNDINSGYTRINAKRIYPSLSKETNEEIPTLAAYPSYYESNNYLIISNNIEIKDLSSALSEIVEMSLYNWPIDFKDKQVSVQTYNLINLREAYEVLSKNEAYLVGIKNTKNKKLVKVDEIIGIDIVDILSVRLEYYEDIDFTKYIQPVYVFITEGIKNEIKYEIIFYVPALSKDFLLE